MFKVTIEYVLNKFPSARRIMLATTKEMSKINYENYLKAGFPIPGSDGLGYEYLPMTNIDADDYPEDCQYVDRIGDTKAWNTWNDGKWDWLPSEDNPDEGFDIPISGGYGRDKHTFIAEFPSHLCK